MLLKLDNCSEVAEGFLPLFLENVDLPPGDIGFDVTWVPHQRLRKCAQGPLIIIDSSVSYRKNNEHSFTVVWTLFDQIAQISDCFSRLTAIQV